MVLYFFSEGWVDWWVVYVLSEEIGVIKFKVVFRLDRGFRGSLDRGFF